VQALQLAMQRAVGQAGLGNGNRQRVGALAGVMIYCVA
jgi:hypothetical protein